MLTKNYIALFIFLSFNFLSIYAESVQSEKNDIGLQFEFYGEPLIKPGASISLDLEKSLSDTLRIALTLPSVTWFMHPDNSQAINLQSSLSGRFMIDTNTFIGIGGGAGFYLSQLLVPLYDMNGTQINDNWNKQLSVTAFVSAGKLFQIKDQGSSFRFTGTIGWRGLLPYNQAIDNHIYITVGFRCRINKEKDKK